MRMACDSFHHPFDVIYVGFDSFEGLLEVMDIYRQDILFKGKLAFVEQEFIDRVVSHGTPSKS